MASVRQNAHRQDIKAAVCKKAGSLAALARKTGAKANTLHAALLRPQPSGNRVIATLLGKSVHELWPEWFDEYGNRRFSEKEDTPRRSRSQRQNGEAA